MTSFWIAVAVSMVSATIFIWSSITERVENNSDDRKQMKMVTMIPILMLLVVPITYYAVGNMDEHQGWLKASSDMKDISSGTVDTSKSMGIQSMLLGLRTSVERDPNNGKLWFMIAEVYFQLSMIDLADAAMQRAIRIDARPDWLVANAQILSSRANSSDISKSINLLQNALSIQPDHQSALLTLGFIYLRQQQYEFAISVWQRLLKLLEKSGNDTSAIKKQIEFAQLQLTQGKKTE